jgi:hypothetical protein
MGGIAQQTGCLARFKKLHADKGAVDQDCELTGEPVGFGNRQPLGYGLQAPPHFVHMGLGYLAGGVIRLRELGRRVDLRATPVVVPSDPLADPLEMSVELG